MNRTARPNTTARVALAVVLWLHLWAVLALAASPRLHHWVHPDADDNDHDCAVVLFLHGGGDAGPGPVVLPMAVVLPAALIVQGRWRADFVPSVFAASRVWEHAPPMVAS